MPQPTPSIFNKRATEKLRSPDDLDKYVRVTNPSVWAVLGACAAFLVGLLVWGIFGSVATNVAVEGAYVDGQVICLLPTENVSDVHEGDTANVNSATLMKVASISKVPLSFDEARSLVTGDYLALSLMTGDWAYVVTLDGDTSKLEEDIPLDVSITTERVAPISLVWGGKR